MNRPAVPNFATYRTVGEAAEYLGVSAATLRNWDRSGKLKPRRHPQNGYRIYLHEDLEAVLRSVERVAAGDNTHAASLDWRDLGECDHIVQFYESDDYLAESVSGFVGAALQAGGTALVAATAEHRLAIERKLAAAGHRVAEAIAAGRFVVLDAEETLSKFMDEHGFDLVRFNRTVGGIVDGMIENGRPMHIFGEMVALLWARGQRGAAIELEQRWNELARQARFALLCAYPMKAFGQTGASGSFQEICSCHTRIIPSETYAGLANLDQRLRAIGSLQQQAQSLEAEIAHRAEVEKILTQRERELADFFENGTEGLHRVGADGTILWANKADYGLLGYAEDEYIGQPISKFHVDADVIDDILCRLTRGETLENHAARLRCKDGRIKHVLINSSACFENGKFVYTRCFTRDVTEQWRAENELRETDRRKDAFLATLAHELRNPLASITNALHMIRQEQVSEKDVEQAGTIMQRQVHQLTRLVDDLLDISRITRDKIELRKQRVELAAVVSSAIDTSRPLIDAANHTLSVTLPTRPIVLEADPDRMAQVLANLLNNSAKYTEPGGRICLNVRQIGREAVISIQDNGIGIPGEALAYVFDMFRQVDQSLVRAQGGLGIGLTLVRRLVELHGGTINAQSEGLGKGSEFVVRLPIAADKVEPVQAAPISEPPSSKRRVLVVDDNKDSGDSLSILLRVKGHEVRTARDGFAAIDVAAEYLPDVILMDVGMPKMDGYETTQRIRQTPWGKQILIVALTGWGQPEDVRRSAEAGCSAHMVKPVDLASLEKLLANSPRQGR